jgi:hypothetical protein
MRTISEPLRRHWKASWILLVLSIINFTLAAPVAVRDIHREHANLDAVDVAEVRMAVLQKCIDPDVDQSSDLTSEHEASYPGPKSGSEPEPESESDSDDSDGGDAAEHPWNQNKYARLRLQQHDSNSQSSLRPFADTVGTQWHHSLSGAATVTNLLLVPSNREDLGTGGQDNN